MEFPFSVEQFLHVFGDYNRAVFPMQFLHIAIAAVTIYLASRRSRHGNHIIPWLLAFLWIWMGVVYHLIFFTAINQAAIAFGILNILQGILFIALRKRLTFHFTKNLPGWVGAAFVLYALIVYPILGMLTGHAYPFAPTFGLPCPTTIFTFGVLLWTEKRPPAGILVIPFLWSLVGFNAALSLGIPEDTGLLVAGVGALILILTSRRPGELHGMA